MNAGHFLKHILKHLLDSLPKDHHLAQQRMKDCLQHYERNNYFHAGTMQPKQQGKWWMACHYYQLLNGLNGRSIEWRSLLSKCTYYNGDVSCQLYANSSERRENNQFNSFLTITGKSPFEQELFSTRLIHVHVNPNLQKRYKSLWDRHLEKSLRRWRFYKLAKPQTLTNQSTWLVEGNSDEFTLSEKC